MFIRKVMQDEFGAIVISIILGLGLAAMFQRACSGDGCMIVKAPKLDELRRYTYKLNDSCYKYSPEVVPCPWKGRRDND